MREILIIDLDHTLLKTDMLFESFWSSLAQDWRNPFRAALASLNGKAALKRYLAESSQVDVTTLPYDPTSLHISMPGVMRAGVQHLSPDQMK